MVEIGKDGWTEAQNRSKTQKLSHVNNPSYCKSTTRSTSGSYGHLFPWWIVTEHEFSTSYGSLCCGSLFSHISALRIMLHDQQDWVWGNWRLSQNWEYLEPSFSVSWSTPFVFSSLIPLSSYKFPCQRIQWLFQSINQLSLLQLHSFKNHPLRFGCNPKYSAWPTRPCMVWSPLWRSRSRPSSVSPSLNSHHPFFPFLTLTKPLPASGGLCTRCSLGLECSSPGSLFFTQI